MKTLFYICIVFILSVCCLNTAKAQQAATVSSAVATVKEAEKPPVIEVSVTDNRIKVTNAPVGSKLEIYSVVGIKVIELDIKNSSGEYPVNIAKGYYIVRIGETVRKIAIR